MLAASLTFHEPSSLPRPPSVPHVYVMKRKKRERESGCASVLQLNARMPTCICGCTCSQFLKGDDLFFNDRIQSGRTNFITKRFFIFTTNHVHTLLEYVRFSAEFITFWRPVVSLQNSNLRRLKTCLRYQ